ncbi:MAG: hypothetical protein U0169_21960 [Polyangiaceae bacterium]
MDRRRLFALALLGASTLTFAACSPAPSGEEEDLEATPVKSGARPDGGSSSASSSSTSTPSTASTSQAPVDMPLVDGGNGTTGEASTTANDASTSAATDGGGGTPSADSGSTTPDPFPCNGGGKLEQEPNDTAATASVGSPFASMNVQGRGAMIATAMCGGLGFFGDSVDHMKFTFPAEAAQKGYGWAFETALVADITTKVTAGGQSVVLATNASLPAAVVSAPVDVEVTIKPGKSGLYRVVFFYPP